MDAAKQFIDRADAALAKVPQLVDLEKRTKVPKTALAGGAAVVALIVAVYLFGALRLATISGFVFPAYATLVHLGGDASKEGSQIWLSYWLVFATFTVLECFGSIVQYWIPLYPLVKAVLLAYLYLPQTQGAKLVYEKGLSAYVIPALGITKPPVVTAAPEVPKKTE